MARFRTWITWSATVAALAVSAAVSFARPVAIASDASAAAAVAHVEAWIKEHPKDATGYRTLAHIHGLAWAYGEKIPLVGSVPATSLPQFTETSSVLVSRTGPKENLWMTKTIPEGVRPERPITADEVRHLAAAIAAYRKAVELDKTDALSELGLGWMLVQQGQYARELPADFFGESKPTDVDNASWAQAIRQLGDADFRVRDTAHKKLLAAMPGCAVMLRDVKSDDLEVKARLDAVLLGYYRLQALEHYRMAYTLRVKSDAAGEPTYQVDSQVSAKAGTQILEVLAQHPEAGHAGEGKAVREVVEVLEKKWTRLMMMPQ